MSNPTANDGWIKLWRKIAQSPVFNNPNTLKIWIWCLVKATHQEMKIEWGGKEYALKNGEFVFGREIAAKELEMKRSTLWDNLKKLAKWQNLDIRSDRWGSIISICKWDKYQGKSDSESDNDPTATRQPPDTNKNVKNVKNNTIPTKRQGRSGCPLVKKSGGKRSHKECVSYISSKGKFPNFAKQIAHLHKILSVGYDFPEIDSLIEEVENEPFYRERGWDFATLANEMGRRR